MFTIELKIKKLAVTRKHLGSLSTKLLHKLSAKVIMHARCGLHHLHGKGAAIMQWKKSTILIKHLQINRFLNLC